MGLFRLDQPSQTADLCYSNQFYLAKLSQAVPGMDSLQSRATFEQAVVMSADRWKPPVILSSKPVLQLPDSWKKSLCVLLSALNW